MAHKLELLGTSGKFQIYKIVVPDIENSDVLSGSTMGTLDKTREEARGNVVIDSGRQIKARPMKRGEIRFDERR